MIATAAAGFISLCLATWQIGDLRPHRFLADTTVEQYNVSAGRATIDLVSSERMEDLIILADAELAPQGFIRRMYITSIQQQPFCGYSRMLGTPGSRDFVQMSKLPGRTYVTVSRSATVTDRIQSWLFNLRRR